MRRRRFYLILASIGVSSLALRALVPPFPLYGAVHDDELMVRLAASLRRGNWLGDYAAQGHLTLSKPPGYPIFLAASSWFPWAPTITIHLLALAGALVFLRELRLIGTPRWVVAAGFALIAFCPFWFGDQLSRVYREGLLASLTMVAIGLAFAVRRRLADPTCAWWSTWRSRAASLATSGALGVVVSLYVATKPSWHGFALLVGTTVSTAITSWSGRPTKRQALIITALFSVLLVGATTVVGYSVAQNQRRYGVAALDTFASGPFKDALNAWSSVRTDSPRRYVQVDAQQREAVYAISPTARELRPFLEYGPGYGWRGSSCASPMKICDESGAWFPWELRDAVQRSGLGESPTQFNRTLAQVAGDIRSACSDGRLACGPEGLAPGIGPLTTLPRRELIDAVVLGAEWLLRPEAGTGLRTVDPQASEDVDDWRLIVDGLPAPVPESTYRANAASLGSALKLLETLYRGLWTPLMIIGLVGMVSPMAHDRTRKALPYRYAQGGLLLAVGVLLAQLALLEVGSGMYVSAGGILYLLPAIPPLLAFAVLGAAQLEELIAARKR